MNLSDALDDCSSSGAGSQSAGSGAWPQQPNQSQWPGGPTNPTSGGGQWPGQQPAAGGGQWPGPAAGGSGGGQWPGPAAGGVSGGGWPGQQPPAGPPAGGGGSGQWPGQQPAAGGGQWPSQKPAAGGGQWPGPAAGGSGGVSGGGWPGQQPPAGGGGSGQWPGQQPAAGGGQWPSPSPSKAPGDWPAPSPGTAPNTLGPLTVPYRQKIPNGLSGRVIHIKGNIKPNANKVTVDLSTDSDLVFHFNPRFNEGGRKVIVRNSKIGGRWGTEERNLSRFPFARGQPFELKIECTTSAFEVSVQGSRLLDFKHRGGNPSQIRSLDISNDVSLSHVSIQ